MKNEQTHQWAQFMRNLLNRKCVGWLKRNRDDGPPEVCAIGAGCIVAGIEHRPVASGRVWGFGKNRDSKSIPPEFKDWLGLRTSRDVRLDAPFYERGGRPMSRSIPTLNDKTSLTLPQIGDLIDFFGVIDDLPRYTQYPERL